MKKVISCAILFFAFSFLFGQARWQADVSIASISLSASKPLPVPNSPREPLTINKGMKAPQTSSGLTCSITVHNENDDDAYGTQLVVTLPVEVSVVSISNGGVSHSGNSGSPYASYITFDIGRMAVGQNSTVTFTISKSNYGNKVGAFAYSGSPDPNPTNNYKQAVF